jgi:hypothetical protein
MKKRKIYFIAILILFVIFGFGLYKSKLFAGTSENVIGWLWGGSDNGAGNSTGLGWVSMNNTTSGGATSYGVNIPVADGAVTGYAWSENIGWISFNNGDLIGCPDGNCSAQRINNKITGWARIMSIPQAGVNAGGWTGYIKLSGTGYGITINPDNTLSGYSWSDELGWIDFSRAFVTTPKTIEANLTASPPSGSAPLTVDFTATVVPEGTTASGNITYDLDCANDGGSYEDTYTTGETSHTFIDKCTYNTSSTASVKVTREGVSVTSPTGILINFCGDSSKTGSEECDEGANNGACPKTCSATCTVNNCGSSRPWREVSPN